MVPGLGGLGVDVDLGVEGRRVVEAARLQHHQPSVGRRGPAGCPGREAAGKHPSRRAPAMPPANRPNNTQTAPPIRSISTYDGASIARTAEAAPADLARNPRL